ncbi:MAG TPA: histidinol phosphatase [Desulfobacteraceae bacterium]|nr:histidinol phosphatase [Desulfobacteraceae bacterium]|tara:strand:+ start:41 stop:895 length:855 start_codon:yes stop_codon:yes gene_type:complete
MTTPTLISLHGGHSGQFCNHADNTLEEIIQAYIGKGFTTVGISEHMPPAHDGFLYPDEIQKGLSAEDLQRNFTRYFEELERLKKAYKDRIRILRAFETETVTGYETQVRKLIERYRPDYIVGSVHHINDVCFDYSAETYKGIAKDLGSMEAMYLAYFDAQYEMIQSLRPFVVGHFDLIRIYDPDFVKRLQIPEVMEKIKRNLSLVKDLGLVLDFNLRPLSRGEASPYLAPVILDLARQMEITVVPGDDAHSKDQAGQFVPQAVHLLSDFGFPTDWPEPRILPMP